MTACDPAKQGFRHTIWLVIVGPTYIGPQTSVSVVLSKEGGGRNFDPPGLLICSKLGGGGGGGGRAPPELLSQERAVSPETDQPIHGRRSATASKIGSF